MAATRQLLQVSLVREETKNSGYCTADHDDQVDKEHSVQALVSCGHSWHTPVVELHKEKQKSLFETVNEIVHSQKIGRDGNLM